MGTFGCLGNVKAVIPPFQIEVDIFNKWAAGIGLNTGNDEVGPLHRIDSTIRSSTTNTFRVCGDSTPFSR